VLRHIGERDALHVSVTKKAARDSSMYRRGASLLSLTAYTVGAAPRAAFAIVASNQVENGRAKQSARDLVGNMTPWRYARKTALPDH